MTVGEEISDGLVALDFLTNQEGVDPERLGIIGLSLGEEVAACVAGEDRRVKSIALRSAWLISKSWHGSPLRKRKEMLERGETDLGRFTLGKSFVEALPIIKPLERVKGFLGSALIIHGETDQIVPTKHVNMF